MAFSRVRVPYAATNPQNQPIKRREAMNSTADEACNSISDKRFLEPSELSKEEYHGLLEQIRTEFSEDECRQELLDAARYNDVDVVRGILSIYPQLSSYREQSSLNSGLHMAAANGHAEVVDLFLSKGPSSLAMAPNASGNTPIHWAAANGQSAVVARLLKSDGCDVLVKNKAGRSALTEGFSSNNEDVVKLLLQHQSASEEKLVATKDKGEEDTVTHKFKFGNIALEVRELAIPDVGVDGIVGQDDPFQDTTGYAIWSASLVMSQWLASLDKDIFMGKVVLELGSGCGVPGLLAGRIGKDSKVYLTDWNPKTLSNLSYNIEKNQLGDSASSNVMNWKEQETWPVRQADIVIGSDLIYQDSMVETLFETVQSLNPLRFFYVAGTQRQGHDRFISLMSEHYSLEQIDCSPAMRKNPFEDQDDERCFLHFHELTTMELKLYDFRIRETHSDKSLQ